MDDLLFPEPEQVEAAPVKKARKPRAVKPKVEKPKKVKPTRDIRTVFREKLAGITVDGIKKPWMAQKVFRLITSAEELQAWADQILADTSRHHEWPGMREWGGAAMPVIAVDTETTSLDTRIFTDIKQDENGNWHLVYEVKVEIAGVCLSADGIEGLYIPINHEQGQNVSRADVARILQKLFDRSHLIFYNGKFDREIMKITLGMTFRPYPFFEDVQVLKYINDPKADFGDKANYQGGAEGLKKLSEQVLQIEQIEMDEVAKVRCHVWNAETQKNTLKQKVVPFTWIPPEIALWYAAADGICTWLLWDRMKGLARSRKLVHRIDHELVDSLAYVERQRFLVDVDRQHRTARWHGRTLHDLESKLKKLAEAAGWTQEFNPGSPPQLSKLLFTIMGFKPVVTTEGGLASTNKETLTELAKDNPDNEFITTLQGYRELASLHPDNLRYDPKDNSARIYLKQNVVGGGRLSGGGGEFEKDGGLEWNPQGVKKLEKEDFWRVYGNVLEPDSVEEFDVEEHDESELHPSCFANDKDADGKSIRVKAPGIIKNHIGIYQDYCVCLIPGCKTCKDKFGLLIEDTSLDANQVVNLRVLMCAPSGWTFFSIDYCVTPETKLLTSDLRWKKSGDIVKGEELIGFDEALPSKRWGRRKLRPSIVEKVERLFLPCVRVTTDKGTVTCYDKHGWLTKVNAGGRKKKRGQYDWRAADELKVGQEIAYLCNTWEEDTSYDAGYLQGVFDGEGWVSKQALGFGQNEGYVLDKTERLLHDKKFDFVKDDNKKRNRVSVLRSNGGRNEVFRFLGSIRPERLLRNARKMWDGLDYQSKCCTPAKIISIEPVGIQEVVAIRTSTHTYIAEGLLSHNCNIEMRAMANLSGEQKYVLEFLTGSGDFHDLTAKNIFPEYSDPTSKMYKSKQLRATAKIINFAINYGGTAHAIYRNLVKKDKTMTMKRAEELVEKYWKGVPMFRQWCDVKQARARNDFVTETATGRVIDFKSAMEQEHIHTPTQQEKSLLRKYYDYKREMKAADERKDAEVAKSYKDAADRLWKNPATGVRNAIDYNQFLGKAQRVAVNTPVQGLCGDFMRIALNRIKKWVERDPDVQKVFRLHGSVHDEIDVIIKNEYVPFILPRLTRWMKLRKYHESMKWPVPIECDAEYGRSWDVDFNVTDKKNPAAFTHIDELERYVPDTFNQTTVNNLYKFIASGDEAKREKAKGYLQQMLHPRAFEATGTLFKSDDRKTIQNQLIAVLQLHEYWTIDHTPDGDEGDKSLETLAQYEERMGINARDPKCPEFGYMGPIPLDNPNVIRPTPLLLDDPNAPLDLPYYSPEINEDVRVENEPSEGSQSFLTHKVGA